MTALRDTLQNSIFIDAQTHIQSGNLIFKSNEKGT